MIIFLCILFAFCCYLVAITAMVPANRILLFNFGFVGHLLIF